MATETEGLPAIADDLEERDSNLPTDLEERDLIALFVLDDIPNEAINKILDENAKKLSGHCIIWLADTYDTLPAYCRGTTESGTDTPIDPKWCSPFIGKTIPEVVAFMRSTPKPPKLLNKRYCAVITKESLEDDSALICKSLEDDSDVESEYDEEDEQPREVVLDEKGEPGTIKEMLLQHIEIGWRDIPVKRRNLKQVIRELGHDFDDIQVIPTDLDCIGEFQFIFERYRWMEAYLEWREQGVWLG